MTRMMLAAGSALVLAGLFYTLWSIDDVAITTAPVDDKVPRYTLSKALLTRYDADGKPALQATAEMLEYFDDESAHADLLKLDVLSGATTPWRVTAPSGTLPAHSRNFLLEGDVLANGNWPDTGEPLTVRTQSLWVDPDKHELHTNRGVTFDSVSRDGAAVGMNANWAEKNLRLMNDVKMRYEAKH